MNSTSGRGTPIDTAHGGAGVVPVELLHCEKDTFVWVVPAIACLADKLMINMFNNVTGKVMRFWRIRSVPKLDVAVAPVIGCRLDLFKTSSIGTGGTAVTAAPSATRDVAGGVIWSPGGDALPSGLDARLTPTGGATKTQWCSTEYVMGEEDQNSMGYAREFDKLNPVHDIPFCKPMRCVVGEGIVVQQGGETLSAGSVGFLVVFTLEPA